VVAFDDSTAARVLAEAAAAWPGVHVPEARFIAALTAALADDQTTIESVHARDLYLALGCLDGQTEALAAFHHHVALVIRPSIARASTDGVDPDDALQTMLEKLLVGPTPKLAQYMGRGPLVGWVRVVAVRQALEARRSQRRERVHDDSRLVDDAAPIPSADVALLRARHGPAFKTAVTEAIQRLTAEQRTILRMNVTDGLSIDRIAPMLGVHRATAARRLEKARTDALEHARAILHDRDGLTESEAASLCVALASEVDVSIGRALRESVAP
jgi:RNA polymerase sigma-70 factor (ECF subfamily)